MKYRVCEQWDMLVPTSQRDWFAGWVSKSPGQSSRHVTAGYHAYSSLLPEQYDTAVEYFGGLGCQSLIIRDLFKPERHVVLEQHPAAVRHLSALLGGTAEVYRADSYAQPAIPADLVGLDFGNMTIRKLAPGEPHRELLDRVMAQQPRAVVLTDIAGARVVIKRPVYEPLLGDLYTDYAGYLRALARWFTRTYGYRVVTGYSQHWSTVLALVPGTEPPGPILPIPASPEGITLQ